MYSSSSCSHFRSCIKHISLVSYSMKGFRRGLWDALLLCELLVFLLAAAEEAALRARGRGSGGTSNSGSASSSAYASKHSWSAASDGPAMRAAVLAPARRRLARWPPCAGGPGPEPRMSRLLLFDDGSSPNCTCASGVPPEADRVPVEGVCDGLPCTMALSSFSERPWARVPWWVPRLGEPSEIHRRRRPSGGTVGLRGAASESALVAGSLGGSAGAGCP
mmetsp:Transcript_108589/g.306964  ORF Transcript_108589/g.306964 Transcript_108589/m.306964 type:complete len:220 (-) Transcript_108589:120-779(-)